MSGTERLIDQIEDLRALLAEVLVTEHVWYGEPEEGHASDCPGCDLESRIRKTLGIDGKGAGDA